LALLVELDDIAGLVALKTQTNGSLKPGLRHFPSAMLFIPGGLVPLAIFEPGLVVHRVWEPNQEWGGPLTLKDHGQTLLALNATEILHRRLCGHGASLWPNRDRKKPHGPSLPHHRTYGSRIRRFLETSFVSCCPGRCQFGQPHLTKQLYGQRQTQRWRLTQPPWTMRTLAGVPSLAHADPAFPEVSR